MCTTFQIHSLHTYVRRYVPLGRIQKMKGLLDLLVTFPDHPEGRLWPGNEARHLRHLSPERLAGGGAPDETSSSSSCLPLPMTPSPKEDRKSGNAGFVLGGTHSPCPPMKASCPPPPRFYGPNSLKQDYSDDVLLPYGVHGVL